MAKVGICALTGDNDVFVRSHIIPKTLTKLSRNGERFMEKSLTSKYSWRSNSWYDYNLVTRRGEDILSKIDEAGINSLRKALLIWSGWNKEWNALPDEYFLLNDVPFNGDVLKVRVINNIDTSTIRIFFLSILWRAAKSCRPEMNDIQLSEEKLSILKEIIMDKTLDKNYIFPMDFDQMITRGIHHNRTPIYEYLTIKYNDKEVTLGYFRIYFEGLVCRIYDYITHNDIFSDLSKMLVQDNNITLLCRSFEKSRSFENLTEVVSS